MFSLSDLFSRIWKYVTNTEFFVLSSHLTWLSFKSFVKSSVSSRMYPFFIQILLLPMLKHYLFKAIFIKKQNGHSIFSEIIDHINHSKITQISQDLVFDSDETQLKRENTDIYFKRLFYETRGDTLIFSVLNKANQQEIEKNS